MSITSDEVNYLVYRYLQESGFIHAAYAFQTEAHIDKNEYKGVRTSPGALVTYIQKGLLYREAEAHLNDDGTERPCTRAFRLLEAHQCDKVSNRSKTKKDKEDKKKIRKLRESEPGSPRAAAMDVDPPPQSVSRTQQGASSTMSVKVEPETATDYDSRTRAPTQIVQADAIVHTGKHGENLRELAAVPSNKTYMLLSGHNGEVFQCAWSPNRNYLATGGADSSIRLWDLDTFVRGEPVGLKIPFSDHQPTRVTCLDWRNDGEIFASGSLDHFGRVWSATGELKHILKGHAGPIFSIKFNPCGIFLMTASVDKKCKLWDPTTGNLMRIFEIHQKPAMDIDWRNDTVFASCGVDGVCAVADISKPELMRKYNAHSMDVNNIRWSPNRQYLATCSDDMTACIFDIDKEEAIHTLRDHKKEVYAIRWANDGKKFATSSTDGTIKVYGFPGAKLLYDLTSHSGAIYTIAFSPDNCLLASGSTDKHVYIHDMKNGRTVSFFNVGHRIYEVKWDGNGSRLAVCTGGGDTFVVNL